MNVAELPEKYSEPEMEVDVVTTDLDLEDPLFDRLVRRAEAGDPTAQRILALG